MKNTEQLGDRYFLYRSVISIIAGLILIAYPDNALRYVAYAIGFFTVIMGVSTLVSQNKYKNELGTKQQNMMKMNSIINIILGMLLIAAPTFFISFLMKMIGIIIILAGVIQLYILYKRKSMNMPVTASLYIMPLIITVMGCVITFYSFPAVSILVRVIGATTAFYGVFELLIRWKINKR